MDWQFILKIISFGIGFFLGCLTIDGIGAIINHFKERKYEKEQEKRLHDRYFD